MDITQVSDKDFEMWLDDTLKDMNEEEMYELMKEEAELQELLNA